MEVAASNVGSAILSFKVLRQPTPSVTVTITGPADRPVIEAVVCGVFQTKVNGVDPPNVDTVAVPSLPPLQVTEVTAKVTVPPTISDIAEVVISVQPFPSVTVTV